jgi:CRP/FNR family transcriptional regulator, cyclic AMP receptor protein
MGDTTPNLPLKIHEARSFLARNGWLSFTPEPFRKQLLSACRLMNYEADQVIYNQGDSSGGMFGLVSGRVAVLVAPQERGPYFAHAMRPGNWFGMASALRKAPRGMGLRATRRSQLLLLPAGEIERIAKEDPTAWRYLAVLAFIISNLSTCAADDLLTRDPAKRCLATLARLAGLRHSTDNCPCSNDVDITQDELANLANLSRNAVGSYLRQFDKSGLIKLGYKSIVILNSTAILRVLSEF